MVRFAPDRLLPTSYPQSYLPAECADQVRSALHLSNMEIAQHFDQARVALMRTMLGEECWTASTGRLVVAYNTIEFVREVAAGSNVFVGSGILSVGSSSVTLGAGLFEQGICVAVSDCVLVRVAAEGPRAWTADERSTMSNLPWRYLGLPMSEIRSTALRQSDQS